MKPRLFTIHSLSYVSTFNLGVKIDFLALFFLIGGCHIGYDVSLFLTPKLKRIVSSFINMGNDFDQFVDKPGGMSHKIGFV